MARRKTIDFRAAVSRVLQHSLLEQVARNTGAFQRERKIGIVPFFWTLVLGFGGGTQRTLAGLRRAFERAHGVRVVPSSFYDRFSPQLVSFMRIVVGKAVLAVGESTTKLRGVLASFADVVMTDATVIRLHEMLERAFPACRTNHTKAALKLHAVVSVNACGPRKLTITSERVHDGPVLKVGRWVAGRLLLFDLAYFRYQLFSCIRRNGGYFIARLKQNATPRIVAVHRGSAAGLLGERVYDVVPSLRRNIVDLEVEVSFPGRRYAGRHRHRSERFRVVGVRNAQTRAYHLYITNVSPARLTAEQVANAYAARWLIELFFREFKDRYRADHMPSRKRFIVEALLYAAILTLIVSRRVRAALLRRLHASERDVPDERWAVLFAEIADDLLVVLSRRTQLARLLAGQITHLLLAEARDPNRGRILLRQRAESANIRPERR